MEDDDATYYAQNFDPLEKAIMLRATATSGTMLKTVTNTESTTPESRMAARRLQSMNLLELEQSRLGRKFHYNYVKLNERGLQVQSALRRIENNHD